MRRMLQQSLLALSLFLLGVAVAQGQEIPPEHERAGGPYVPTPNLIVDQMLEMAKVTSKDHVIDLGSGDGIIVLTAARRFGSSGYGVDIDPELVQLSNQRARNMGFANRVRFETKDIFKADVSKATVVTLYLLPTMMRALLPKLFRELQPGTRIVSHDYHFDSWPHADAVTIDAPEKEMIIGIPQAVIYLWVVPAKVGGNWRLSVEGGDEQELALRQNYDGVNGNIARGATQARFTEMEVSGPEIRFVRDDGRQKQLFRGRVEGDRMTGTVELGVGKVVRWSAVRSKSS